ncbi:MAG: SMC-Scp complex subunit ScpB [Acidimicrobiia bacterium]|nr:SMC-Scp complex subunit ScpB [Acidimicrobiia bacterium]
MATQTKLQLADPGAEASSVAMTAAELKPILEAMIYVADEPVSEATLVTLLGKQHQEAVREALRLLLEQSQSPERGLEIKEVAGGYKMATKAEHHEWVRKYVKHHTPATKLSLASLETLAVIAYRQPITVPEIQEVRGVNAVSVLKTLLDKKLITTAGRKNVVGRPILYRTTKEFLVHFGLKNLDELPSLEEFEDLARAASETVAELPATETIASGIPGAAMPSQEESAGEAATLSAAETDTALDAPEATLQEAVVSESPVDALPAGDHAVVVPMENEQGLEPRSAAALGPVESSETSEGTCS